jgi:tetratricopeptide (TPR) repeat protein
MSTGKSAASSEQVIKMLESSLARIPPTSPAYAQIQAQIEQLRKAPQAPAAPKAEPNAPPVGSRKPVSAQQALRTLQGALEGSVSAKDLQALEASDEAKDADSAELAAVAAMASGKVHAALALELRAQQLEPKNATHLVNLSGLANHYGLWQESLALADAAGALGVQKEGALIVSQQAALLNNRAHALLHLDRAAEAEVLLRQALTLSPLLAEARTNLAMALGKQNKCKEAMRFLRAGHWRKPPMQLASGPEQEQAVEEVKLKPFEEIVDQKRGEPGHLPQLRYILTPDEVKGAAAWYAQEEKRAQEFVKNSSQRFTTEAMNASARLQQLASAKDREGFWTWKRADYLYGQIQGGMPGRDLPRRYKEFTAVLSKNAPVMTQLEMQYLKRERASSETLSARIQACKGREAGVCQAHAQAEHHERMCDATKAWATAWRTPMNELETAIRDYHREHHRATTAVFAYLSDPVLVRAAGARIAMNDALNYMQLLSPVANHVRELARRMEACQQPPASAFDLEGYEEDFPAECKPGKSKPKAKAVVLEVSYTCEQVEFEVAVPTWLTGFVNVTYQFSKRYERLKDPKERFIEESYGGDPDHVLVLREYGHAFGGKLTVTAGGKVSGTAEVGVIAQEASVKGGVYVTVNGGGDLLDVGMKVDTSVSRGVEVAGFGTGVEVSGPGAQVSFVSSE